MRNSARAVLAIVVFMTALLLAPWRGQTGTPDAVAQIRQPTPNLCDVLCENEPDEGDDDEDGGSGGDGGGGDDDGGSGG